MLSCKLTKVAIYYEYPLRDSKKANQLSKLVNYFCIYSEENMSQKDDKKRMIISVVSGIQA